MNLHIELTKTLKPYLKDSFLVAVSGGLDSMALFHLFLHFRKNFGVSFSVVHFHHGPCSKSDQLNFRFKAYRFVKDHCEKWGVDFLSNYDGGSRGDFLGQFGEELLSEESLRQARDQFFQSGLNEQQAKWVALAHHQEDQLETRLLRLLRGTGPEGLKAMTLTQGFKLRPLLNISKEDLRIYLDQAGGSFLDDPSNKSLDPLRNWTREFWLPELENKFPGATGSLHRSLDLLVSSLDQSEDVKKLSQGPSISLSDLLSLSPSDQRQVLACYMKGQGLKNYGVSHINEILKRLDREEKRHTFRLLGRRWNVDAGRMSLSEPG